MNLNPIDFRAAFNLPPEEAVKYLASKGYKITDTWRDMLDRAHNTTFTSAGVLRMDILTELRNSLVDAVGTGLTVEQWKEELEDRLASIGVGDTITQPTEDGGTRTVKLTPHRLETIFRTNVQSALSAGQMIQQNEFLNERPYRRFNFVNDSRQSDICRKLESVIGGKVLHHSHPLLKRAIGPNHYQCRTTVSSLSESEVRRKGLSILDEDTGSDWQASEGFNKTPLDEYEPDVSKYPKGLTQAYRNFLVKRRQETDERSRERGVL